MEFTIVWFVALGAAFLFLIVLPQRRRLAAQRTLLEGLKVGDEVVIGSGIYGRIRAVDALTLELEIAPGTVVKVARGAVVGIVEPEASAGQGVEPEAGAGDGGSGAGPER